MKLLSLLAALIVLAASLNLQADEAVAYVVVEGDDMYEIAKRFGTTVDALVGYNDLPSTAIQTGQKLIIPK